MDRSTSSNTYAVLAVLVLGALLRFYDLGAESFWVDEGHTFQSVSVSVREFFHYARFHEHPPLYFLICHFWAKAFGTSEIALRIPSAIFGCLSIWCMYRLGLLLFSHRAGLIGALLLALSRVHVYQSQNARMYSLMVLLILLSMIFYCRLLQVRQRRYYAGYFIATLCLIYTHTFGFFIVLAQNVFMAARYLWLRDKTGPTFLKWCLLQACIGLAYLPWLRMLILQSSRVSLGWWTQRPRLVDICHTLVYLSAGVPLLVIFAAFSLFLLVRTRYQHHSQKEQFTLLFLLLWISVPIMSPFIFSLVAFPVFSARYTIGASMGLYLLAAAGIAALRYRRWAAVAVGVIMMLSLFNLWNSYYKTVVNEQWRETVAYLESHATPGDLVLFNHGFNTTAGAFPYYYTRDDLVLKPFPSWSNSFVTSDNIGLLDDIIEGRSRVWLLLHMDGDRQGLLRNKLHSLFELAHKQNFHKISLTLYETKRSPGAGAKHSGKS